MILQRKTIKWNKRIKSKQNKEAVGTVTSIEIDKFISLRLTVYRKMNEAFLYGQALACLAADLRQVHMDN